MPPDYSTSNFKLWHAQKALKISKSSRWWSYDIMAMALQLHFQRKQLVMKPFGFTTLRATIKLLGSLKFNDTFLNSLIRTTLLLVLLDSLHYSSVTWYMYEGKLPVKNEEGNQLTLQLEGDVIWEVFHLMARGDVPRGSKDEVAKASKKLPHNHPLCFSGAVWTDCPNYQILSTILPLFWHATDAMMCQSAAHRIGAFTKACQRLKELYVKYNRTPENFKDLQSEFPHPRCYKILDRQDWVHFRWCMSGVQPGESHHH
ncbi:hypothetical protein EDC04DRAFT_2600312 [Pisolithus marmoratus]|nr:hypothetical protein EDC04DRAFT_2600312 [Pisolithus marmoratus]